MSYRFHPASESVPDGVRRIVDDQLSAAIGALEKPDPRRGLHEARKRVKKLRALLRLVQGAFPDHAAENRYLRDAARIVSDLRDLTVQVETYDAIAARHEGDSRALGPLRRELTAARDRATADPETADRLATFRDTLATVREAASDWQLDDDGWEALSPGVMRGYKRARDAMPDDAGVAAKALHGWRKRVKDHRAHTRLLRMAWPAVLTARAAEAYRLGQLLGEHHDLAVLAKHPAVGGLQDRARDTLAALVARRQAELAEETLTLGKRLFAGKPKDLRRRWRAGWALAEAGR